MSSELYARHLNPAPGIPGISIAALPFVKEDFMEKNFSYTGSDLKSGAQKIASEIKTEARNIGAAARNSARDLGHMAQVAVQDEKNFVEELAGEAKSRGKELAKEARRVSDQGLTQARRAARSFSLYSRENTTVVTLGALAVGVFLGRMLTPARN